MSREEIIDKVKELKAVAIVRLQNEEDLMPYINAIYEGGIKVIEVTLTTPNALSYISQVANDYKDILIGAGSVVNAQNVQEVVDAGAQYIVTPITKKEIIDKAHELNIPVMSGAFSPGEILMAHELGAEIVKVFPADMLGMSYIKAVKAPMPYLNLMPTGGVTLTNGGEWIQKGACAVGIGSSLFKDFDPNKKNFEQITANAHMIVQSLS